MSLEHLPAPKALSTKLYWVGILLEGFELLRSALRAVCKNTFSYRNVTGFLGKWFVQTNFSLNLVSCSMDPTTNSKTTNFLNNSCPIRKSFTSQCSIYQKYSYKIQDF